MAHTRRIVMFNRVAANGAFAGPDGSLDWVVPDAGVDAAGAAAIPNFDTVMLGRRTYEMFAEYWPDAIDDSPSASDPHSAGRQSPAIRAMGVWLNGVTKLVFSRTSTGVTWNNSHLVHELDPAAIETIKRQPGRDIIIFGSGSIVSQLTRHGLIDEYQLIVSPVVAAGGRPLFDPLPANVRLTLAGVKQYESGNVMLRYGRTG